MTDHRKLDVIKTEDGSHSLYVPHLKETYHSFHGAVQESRHVFISSGLTYFHDQRQVKPVNLLELGLGTGLNALLAVEWAVENDVNVNMTSVEAYPVPHDTALKLNYAEFLASDEAAPWFEQIHTSDWDSTQQIHSNFLLQKVHGKFEEISLTTLFDVVFFDAFAPNKQSELWELPILQKVYDALAERGVFVTYCAKGQLKRDLKAIGFEVETLPGPPGKKEMVRGIKL